MRLLLHVCCAPCAIHPFETLKEEDVDEITGFFYNPNIHPYTEYINRKRTLEEYSKSKNFPIVFYKYDLENFFRRVSGHEESQARCRICWRMRLEEAALFGAQNNYNLFTTTLLVSPYQDQDVIRRIGQEVAEEYGINFLYRDLRSGFKAAQDKAKNENLYKQRYCGCVFSERERFEKGKR